jgi:hypothetical protein
MDTGRRNPMSRSMDDGIVTERFMGVKRWFYEWTKIV